jgi:hypothetical protein
MQSLKALVSVLLRQLIQMLKCKNCAGFVYEEEVYYDENDKRIVQIGCYKCSHKTYVESSKWEKFKADLEKAIKKRG